MMRSMLFWMRTSSPSSSSFCTSAFPSGLSWWVEFKKVSLWKPWHVWRQQSGQSHQRQLFPFLSQLWRQCHSSPGIQNETCFWKKKKSHLVDLLACESATFGHTNVARVVGERLCDICPCSSEPGSKEITFDHQCVFKCPVPLLSHKIIIKQRHWKNKWELHNILRVLFVLFLTLEPIVQQLEGVQHCSLGCSCPPNKQLRQQDLFSRIAPWHNLSSPRCWRSCRHRGSPPQPPVSPKSPGKLESFIRLGKLVTKQKWKSKNSGREIKFSAPFESGNI